MTLIEVLIATTLTMILLSAITFFYRQVHMLDKESEKLQKEQFKLAYLEKRLSSILPKIIAPSAKDFYFFTSNAFGSNLNLVFTYDAGVSLDQKKSNHQLGRLYIDDKHNLVLASWESPKRWIPNTSPDMKKEILIENVNDLQFEFYMPPSKNRTEMHKSKKIPEIQPENSWHKNWSYRHNQLPALIKIHVTTEINKKAVPIVFAFSCPKSNYCIMYEN